MIEHIDEAIIKLRKRKELEEEKNNLDFTKLITINKVSYSFEKRIILDNLFSIIVPAGFEIMEEINIKKKYPLLEHPDLILTNVFGNINFTFSVVKNYGENQNILEIKEGIKQAILLAAPANLFYEEGISENVTFEIAYFDFKSFSLEGQIYNMMYIFFLKEKMILGNFNCPFEFYDDWRMIILEILNSITMV